MLLLVVHIRANGVTTYVCSFCFVMVFVLLICWDWILFIFSPLGIVFSYVFVSFFLDFSLFLSKCCSHRTYYDFFLVWSDVRRCLLPEFRSLIMMHSWRFQTLPGIGIRPVKKEGFYIISENINFLCTPLDVASLQIYIQWEECYTDRNFVVEFDTWAK